MNDDELDDDNAGAQLVASAQRAGFKVRPSACGGWIVESEGRLLHLSDLTSNSRPEWARDLLSGLAPRKPARAYKSTSEQREHWRNQNRKRKATLLGNSTRENQP